MDTTAAITLRITINAPPLPDTQAVGEDLVECYLGDPQPTEEHLIPAPWKNEIPLLARRFLGKILNKYDMQMAMALVGLGPDAYSEMLLVEDFVSKHNIPATEVSRMLNKQLPKTVKEMEEIIIRQFLPVEG